MLVSPTFCLGLAIIVHILYNSFWLSGWPKWVIAISNNEFGLGLPYYDFQGEICLHHFCFAVDKGQLAIVVVEVIKNR